MVPLLCLMVSREIHQRAKRYIRLTQRAFGKILRQVAQQFDPGPYMDELFGEETAARAGTEAKQDTQKEVR